MKNIILFIVSVCLSILLPAQKVFILTIDGTINPASADFIKRSIENAEKEKSECLVIRLNTPGGLIVSTRTIVSNILDSKVPVVVYISPAGAHAGSAGVFITMAANIAVMAPGTNIGAAHPVGGGTETDTIMSQKATNDAVAFIKTITEKRKRNVEWAEDAVRKSISLTETEALEKHVIDTIATNMKDLLTIIDGRSVSLNGTVKLLNTKNALTEEITMGFTDKLLNLISDPNLMYILFILGLYGLIFELYNPGAILPGIVGVISLILAFYSMQTLPVNYAGIALIVFAVILFVLELKIVSHGLLAIGGIISLLLGSLMLFQNEPKLEYVNFSKTVVLSIVVMSAVFFIVVLGYGIKAQRSKAVTGVAGMIGESGTVLEILNPTGVVYVHGERWNAESLSGTIDVGTKIRVIDLVNMQLKVEKDNT